MNGPPQKPTTARSGSSSRRTIPIASSTGANASSGSGTRRRATSSADRTGEAIDRTDTLDELDVEAHADDRGHDVGEEDGGVDAVAADGLQRHLGARGRACR